MNLEATMTIMTPFIVSDDASLIESPLVDGSGSSGSLCLVDVQNHHIHNNVNLLDTVASSNDGLIFEASNRSLAVKEKGSPLQKGSCSNFTCNIIEEGTDEGDCSSKSSRMKKSNKQPPRQPSSSVKTCRTFGLTKIPSPDSKDAAVVINNNATTNNNSLTKLYTKSMMNETTQQLVSDRIFGSSIHKTERCISLSNHRNRNSSNQDITVTNTNSKRYNIASDCVHSSTEEEEEEKIRPKPKRNTTPPKKTKLPDLHKSLPIINFTMDEKLFLSPPKRKNAINVRQNATRKVSTSPKSNKGSIRLPVPELRLSRCMSPMSCITFDEDEFSLSTDDCPSSIEHSYRTPSSFTNKMRTSQSLHHTLMKQQAGKLAFQLPLQDDISSSNVPPNQQQQQQPQQRHQQSDSDGVGIDAPPRAPQRDRSPIQKTMALHLSYSEIQKVSY